MPSSGQPSLIKPDILSNVFKNTALDRGDALAMKVMRNKKELSWSWKEYYRDAVNFAKSLNSIGAD
jgi:hypothetical protein